MLPIVGMTAVLKESIIPNQKLPTVFFYSIQAQHDGRNVLETSAWECLCRRWWHCHLTISWALGQSLLNPPSYTEYSVAEKILWQRLAGNFPQTRGVSSNQTEGQTPQSDTWGLSWYATGRPLQFILSSCPSPTSPTTTHCSPRWMHEGRKEGTLSSSFLKAKTLPFPTSMSHNSTFWKMEL